MTDQFRTALSRAEERLTAQQDRLFERLESRFERLEAKFEQRLDATDRDTQREFGEARRDLGELRDLVTKHGGRLDAMDAHRDDNMRASAEGAAKGAGEAAGAVAVRAAAVVAADRSKPFLETFWGKAVVVGTGVSALAGAVGLVPNIIKYGGIILKFIGGLK